eukprot:132214-Rhodomonas_salina.1
MVDHSRGRREQTQWPRKRVERPTTPSNSVQTTASDVQQSVRSLAAGMRRGSLRAREHRHSAHALAAASTLIAINNKPVNTQVNKQVCCSNHQASLSHSRCTHPYTQAHRGTDRLTHWQAMCERGLGAGSARGVSDDAHATAV